MTAKLKTLGAAFIAIFAISAIAASAASASEFTGTAGDTFTGTGTSNQVFVTSVGTVSCKKLTATGTIPAPSSSELTISPVKYEECTAFGLSATVNFGTCDFRFHAGESTGTGKSSGSVDIVCSTGKIVITAPGCTVEVGPQNGLKKVNYEAVSGTIHLTAEVTGISYNFSGSLCGTGSGTEGTYNGTATVTAPHALGITP